MQIMDVCPILSTSNADKDNSTALLMMDLDNWHPDNKVVNDVVT